MQKLRCKKCGSTLLFHDMQEGTIEIMCRQTRCKTINKITCDNGLCIMEEKIVHADNQLKNVRHVIAQGC